MVALSSLVGVIVNVALFLNQQSTFTPIDTHQLCSNYKTMMKNQTLKSVLEGTNVTQLLGSHTIPSICRTVRYEMKLMINPTKLFLRMIGPVVSLPGFQGSKMEETYNKIKIVETLVYNKNANPDMSKIMGGGDGPKIMNELADIKAAFETGMGSKFDLLMDALLRAKKTVDFCLAKPFVSQTSDVKIRTLFTNTVNNVLKTVDKTQWCNDTNIGDMNNVMNQYMESQAGGKRMLNETMKSIPFLNQLVKVLRPLKDLPGFDAVVKTLWSKIEPWEDKTSKSAEIITYLANPAMMAALTQLGNATVSTKVMDMTLTADQYVKYCEDGALEKSWVPDVATVLGSNSNDKQICNVINNLPYKKSLQALIAMYKPGLEGVKIAYPEYREVVAALDYVKLTFKTMRPFFDATGFNPAVRKTVIGLTPMVHYNADDIFLLLVSGKVMPALKELDKRSYTNSVVDMVYAVDQFVKYCDDGETPRKWYPDADVLLGTQDDTVLCKAMNQGFRKHVDALKVYFKAGIDESMKALSYEDSNGFKELQRELSAIQLTYEVLKPFFLAPGFDEQLKNTLKGVTPLVKYKSSDAFLAIAGGKPAVENALVAMDTENIKKALEETIGALATLPYACENVGEAREGLKLMGTTRYADFCSDRDLSGVMAKIEELKKSEDEKQNGTAALTKRLVQLQWTMAITKQFRSLPGFDQNLESLLAKLDFAAEVDLTDPTEQIKLLANPSLTSLRPMLESPEMTKKIKDAMEAVGVAVEACKEPKVFTDLQNLVKNSTGLSSLCGVVNNVKIFGGKNVFKSKIDTLVNYDQQSSSAATIAVSIGVLLYSALAALVLILQM